MIDEISDTKIYRMSRAEICAPTKGARKGQEDSAQGFNPGDRPSRSNAP